MRKKTLVWLALAAYLAWAWWWVWSCRRGEPYDEDKELADLQDRNPSVAIRQVGGKGLGVVAQDDIHAWTFIGVYPGKTFTTKQHQARKAKGIATDEYAIEFWTGTKGEKIDFDFIRDPRENGTWIRPEYAHAIAPHMNEPGPTDRPNVVWVWNFPKKRMEFWTKDPVPKGEEITICYGQHYGREYKTACTEAAVEPQRYAIAKPAQKAPQPYSDVVPDDVCPA